MPFGGPLEVLEVLTPVMSATTLLLSLATEQLWNTLPESPYFSSVEHVLVTFALIFFGAVLAFLMVWTEYQVTAQLMSCAFCMLHGAGNQLLQVAAVRRCVQSLMGFGNIYGCVDGCNAVSKGMSVFCCCPGHQGDIRTDVHDSWDGERSCNSYNSRHCVS